MRRIPEFIHERPEWSTFIGAKRKECYRELERAQRAGLDITPWLTWFLGCLGRAIERADGTLGAVLGKARLWRTISRKPVNDRQRLVLNRLMSGFEGFLTSSKYAKLAKCSADTALRDIHGLVDRGVLAPNPGGGRSTSYRLGVEDSFERGPPP